MSRAHPDCWQGTYYLHESCMVPSGHTCIEAGCENTAGTRWGPHWCPPCDVERLDGIDAALAGLQARLWERADG